MKIIRDLIWVYAHCLIAHLLRLMMTRTKKQRNTQESSGRLLNDIPNTFLSKSLILFNPFDRVRVKIYPEVTSHKFTQDGQFFCAGQKTQNILFKHRSRPTTVPDLLMT